MSDSTISGMPPASLPLGDEAVPCVQDGNNVQVPAAAFGIPVVGDAAPVALAQFQTWIDTSTAPPTLRMYVGSSWVALYTVDGDGTLALAKPLGLSSDDNLTGALKFKSVIDCSVSPNYPPADLGDFYVVSVAGKIGGAAGVSVQVGDTLLCLVNDSPSDTQANIGANWTIGQNNIVGAVTGPASSTGGDFAQFADATGKVVQDNGLVLDTDYSMAASSDTHIPSQNAVKIYIADALARYNTAVVYQGPIACSGNPNYPAGVGGDLYLILSAGKIGGVSGINVEIGDMILCHTTVPSGNQSTIGWAWNVIQNNIDGAVTGPASSTGGHFTQFADATGKVIQDSNLILDTDATMAANSDNHIPSQKAVKGYVSGIAGQNLLVNSAFDIWQETTSYALNTGPVKTHIADFWKVGIETSTTRNASRVSGIQGSLYAAKLQRSPTGGGSTATHLVQQFEHAESAFLAGKTATVSFDFTVGANYAQTTGPFAVIFYGTGVDEDLILNTTPPSFATGGGSVTSADLSSQVAAYGSVSRIVSGPLTIPSTATEVALSIRSGTYGTGGSDDSFTIANVKLEIGSTATPYRKPDFRDELLRCQWRYQKSFAQATVPTQNAGAGTGEFLFRRAGSGTASEGCLIPLKRTMRGPPAITLGNPSAANGQIRNESGTAADCASSTADNISENGFRVTCTGNSGGSAGDWLGVHWIADKRL